MSKWVKFDKLILLRCLTDLPEGGDHELQLEVLAIQFFEDQLQSVVLSSPLEILFDFEFRQKFLLSWSEVNGFGEPGLAVRRYAWLSTINDYKGPHKLVIDDQFD